MDDITQFKGQNNITIADVANALGVSKTTVSRAISGKGRVGDDTRKRVMKYISENNYSPSMAAKGLACSKTYNIGWIMPGDSDVAELPFFQSCVMGISETAELDNYDILLIIVYKNDISQLERVIQNKKVDGFILGRTLVKDKCLEVLRKSRVPYVTIGSTWDNKGIQVDDDHVKACYELISVLINKGIENMAMLGGGLNHVVNQKRLAGFKKAFQNKKMKTDDSMFFMDLETKPEIEKALEDALNNKPECIVCTDDYICGAVLGKLNKIGMSIPGDIKIVSLYNSTALDINKPQITALEFDPKELGAAACRQLIDYLDGKKINVKTYLKYKLLLRGSA